MIKDLVEVYFIDVDLNLVDHILKFKDTHEGVKYTNVGGWHSKYTDLVFPWFKNTVDSILEKTSNKYKVEKYWFNVNGLGHYNKWHMHSPKNIVAVYYIKVPPNSGNIEFRKNKKSEVETFEPKEGQLLIFPGNVEHQVCENKSEDIRISCAFNLKERPQCK